MNHLLSGMKFGGDESPVSEGNNNFESEFQKFLFPNGGNSNNNNKTPQNDFSDDDPELNEGEGFNLKEISLIVFDECHHIRKNTPYHKIIQNLNSIKPKQQKPLVLGLSASLSYSNDEKQIEFDVLEMKRITNCEIIMPESKEIAVEKNISVGTKIETNVVENANYPMFDAQENIKNKEDFFQYLENSQGSDFISELYKWTKYFESEMSKYIKNFKSPFKEASIQTTKTSEIVQNIKKKMVQYMQNDQDFIAKTDEEKKDIFQKVKFIRPFLIVFYRAIHILFVAVPYRYDDICFYFLCETLKNKKYIPEKSETDSFNMPLLINKFFPILRKEFLTKWESHFFGPFSMGTKGPSQEEIRAQRTPLLTSLKNKLTNEYNARGSDFKGMLFIQEKINCQALEIFISTDSDLSLIFNCGSIYGNSSMAKSQRREKILQFKNGDLNLLIATPVAEEGLDIAECNTVIRFDVVQNSVSFIQRFDNFSLET